MGLPDGVLPFVKDDRFRGRVGGANSGKEKSAEISDDSKTSLQKSLDDITQNITKGIAKQVTGTPDLNILRSYSEILNSVANVNKTIPISRNLSFGLNQSELWVLVAYGIGSILLALTFKTIIGFTEPADIISILMYWSTIFAILLGVQTLPKIFGKTNSAET